MLLCCSYDNMSGRSHSKHKDVTSVLLQSLLSPVWTRLKRQIYFYSLIWVSPRPVLEGNKYPWKSLSFNLVLSENRTKWQRFVTWCRCFKGLSYLGIERIELDNLLTGLLIKALTHNTYYRWSCLIDPVMANLPGIERFNQEAIKLVTGVKIKVMYRLISTCGSLGQYRIEGSSICYTCSPDPELLLLRST